MRLISEEHRAFMRAFNEGCGSSPSPVYAKPIAALVGKMGARTILDYGCGPGLLKPALEALGVKARIFEYDPAIPGKIKCPEADLVMCLHTLEYVEPEFLPAVISHMAEKTKKLAYVTISHAGIRVMIPSVWDGPRGDPAYWGALLGKDFLSVDNGGSVMDGDVVKSWLLLKPKHLK